MSMAIKASLGYMRCCRKHTARRIMAGKDPPTMGQNSSLL